MTSSLKHRDMRPASELRDLLLGIPMDGPDTVELGVGTRRGRSWGREHREDGVRAPNAGGYACGNFALTGGTQGPFDELGTEHSVAISWMVDVVAEDDARNYFVYYGPDNVDPGAPARRQGGRQYAWKGEYLYVSPERLDDDRAPVFDYIPPLVAGIPPMPRGYGLTNGEWGRLRRLWDEAVLEPLQWTKKRFTRSHAAHDGCPGRPTAAQLRALPDHQQRRGSGCPAYVDNIAAEQVPSWGDCLLRPDAYAPLDDGERRILQNNGPRNGSAAMRFFHKLMKRVAELYGWSIKDYDWAPGRGRFPPANGVGIAIASCSWWAADHWGLVVTNATNPAGVNMPYAFFQQVPDDDDGQLDCYGTRLWDEGRAVTVLWVDRVPELVLDKIRAHYY